MLRSNRPFLLFYIGRTIDLAGSSMVPLVLTSTSLQETGSISDTGIILAANVLPTLALILFGGVLADRVSRAHILIATCLCSAVSQAAMATMVLCGKFSVSLMALFAAASGTITAFSTPALRGIVPDLVERGDVQQANAYLATSKNFMIIMGPAIAGILMFTVRGGWALAIDSFTFLIAALFFRQIPGRPHHQNSTKIWADLKEGMHYFASLRWIWTVNCCYALINIILVGPWQILGSDLVGQKYTVAVWGAVLAVRALAMFLSSTLLVKFHFKDPFHMGLVLGSLTGLPLVCLGLSLPLGVLIFSVVLAAFGMTTASITYDSTVQSQVPKTQLSRITAIGDLLSFVTIPLSQILIGPIAGVIGVHLLALMCGTGVVLLHFVPFLVKDVRKMPGYCA